MELSDTAVYESLKAWVLKLPGVSQARHIFGGTEFLVDNFHFMHNHGNSILDIRLALNDQSRILMQRLANEHRYAPQAGWVTVSIRNGREIENAKKVILLAYENARRIMAEHKARRDKGPKRPIVKQEKA